MSNENTKIQKNTSAAETINVTKLIYSGGNKVLFNQRPVQLATNRLYTASAAPSGYFISLGEPIEVSLNKKKER